LTRQHTSENLDFGKIGAQNRAGRDLTAVKVETPHALGHSDKKALLKALRSPEASPQLISRGLEDKDWHIRRVAILNPNATVSQIEEVLRDRHPEVRKAAIKSEKCSFDLINLALSDNDSEVRRSALEHPRTKVENIGWALVVAWAGSCPPWGESI